MNGTKLLRTLRDWISARSGPQRRNNNDGTTFIQQKALDTEIRVDYGSA